MTRPLDRRELPRSSPDDDPPRLEGTVPLRLRLGSVGSAPPIRRGDGHRTEPKGDSPL